MGALAPETPWIAKDDLLLKNAIEAGASLESLAKGAVQFSRRFTMKELQDRWYYLLYDPHISTEASTQMIELERSACKPPSKSSRVVNSKDDKCGHGKRKAKSIRSSFKNYVLRKRICSEPHNLGEPYNFSGGGAPGVNGMLEDPIAFPPALQGTSLSQLEYFSQVLMNSVPLCGADEFPTEQPSSLEGSIEQNNIRKEIPVENNVEGNCIRLGPIDPLKELPGDHSIFEAIDVNPVSNSKDIMSYDFGGHTISNSPMPGCEASFDHMHYTSPLPEITDWKDLTDALFDLSDEEIREDAIDKSYLDGLNSWLFNSSFDDEMPKMLETKESAVPVEYPDIPANAVPEEDSSGELILGDIHMCTSDTQVSIAASTVGPESLEDTVICTLNTEDLEIPCNDNVVFPSKPQPVSTHRRTQNEITRSGLPGKEDVNSQGREKAVGTLKRESKQFGGSNPAPLPKLSRTADEFGMNCSENSSCGAKGPGRGGLSVKMEPLEFSLVRQCGSSGAVKSSHVSDSGYLPSTVGGINQEGNALPSVRNQGLYDEDLMDQEPEADLLLSDQSEEQLSDSDEEIPCFSDVESMILNMDLSPDDRDSFWSKEVAKYQHEDTMREIIRLEQNFDSCTRRPSASRGAFAVLYGLRSKHYIKKPEVLIGRAADGVDVDIDLGREGNSRISRRQAIIKMDKNGAFYMKNIGRCLVYMNGEKIVSGECFRLPSSCTIAIREIWFNFETNPGCVKRYLSKVTRKYGSKGVGLL